MVFFDPWKIGNLVAVLCVLPARKDDFPGGFSGPLFLRRISLGVPD
jgi:hypothetical protein